MTRPELATLLGRDSRALRRPLEKLVDHKIITPSGRSFSLGRSWEEALERAAMVTGANRTEARQRATHDAERFVFRVRLERRSAPEVFREAA